MPTTTLNLRGATLEEQKREHEAIHTIHALLTADHLIALADYARENPDKAGQIIDAIESKSVKKMIGLAGTLFTTRKNPQKK